MLVQLAEKSWVPDMLLRAGIRKLGRNRLDNEHIADCEKAAKRYQELIEQLKQSPLAIETDKANEQHYELPTEFFKVVLGKNLKYSSCYYETGNENLTQAEDAALAVSCERAQLEDGMAILELGCGWGSLTLWMASHYPNAQITAVSNSNSQREYINSQLEAQGLSNVTVITCDVNALELEAEQFDRVVSIEMFEHVRNYQHLFANIFSWLKPEGKLWCHVFCHRFLMYPFEVKNEHDWMSEYFFTGGIMPAYDTFLSFQNDLTLENRWLWAGSHYEKTANHWLENMDKNKKVLWETFKETYGSDATVWWQRWRLFFMACAEIFGLDNGNQWGVAHYLFQKK